MSNALEKWLNVFDMAVKHSERATAEKKAQRDAKRGGGESKLANRAFGGAVEVPKDPSCCLASRRLK